MNADTAQANWGLTKSEVKIGMKVLIDDRRFPGCYEVISQAPSNPRAAVNKLLVERMEIPRNSKGKCGTGDTVFQAGERIRTWKNKPKQIQAILDLEQKQAQVPSRNVKGPRKTERSHSWWVRPTDLATQEDLTIAVHHTRLKAVTPREQQRLLV